MGVNHRGRGTRPREFQVGVANANCSPPDFIMFQNLKDQIACIRFTMQKNVMPTLAVQYRDQTITSLQAEKLIQHFSDKGTDKRYCSEYTKTCYFQ